MRQLPHAEVVDDEQRHGGEIREVRLAGAVEGRVGDLLHERVRFAIDDAIALLDHRAADGLRQMAFPRPWWPEKERIFALRDKATGGQVVDERAIHLLVEIKVKAIERAIGIAEAGLFVPALEEPVLSTQELVGHQRRHEIDRA